MSDLAARAETLKARLSELEKRLQGLEKDLDAPKTRDWEDRAIEQEGDEVMEDLGRAGLAEIEAIRAALGRIDAGEYGFCTICGEQISEERLDLLPATPFCKNCAP